MPFHRTHLKNKIMLLFFTVIIAASIGNLPEAMAVQEMSKDSALGVGGKSKFGIGIDTGTVTTLSLYKETNDINFFQLSGNFGFKGAYMGTLDYCQNFAISRSFSSGIPYGCLGLVALYQNENSIINQVPADSSNPQRNGMRVPLGVNYNLPLVPVQIGAELTPTFFITPNALAYVQATMRARLMF